MFWPGLTLPIRVAAQGDRLKEAQNINKSLSALGDCVQSLVAKAKHVPFRNSKLTFLLQARLPLPPQSLSRLSSFPSPLGAGPGSTLS